MTGGIESGDTFAQVSAKIDKLLNEGVVATGSTHIKYMFHLTSATDVDLKITTSNSVDYIIDWGENQISSLASGVVGSHIFSSSFTGDIEVLVPIGAEISGWASRLGDWSFDWSQMPYPAWLNSTLPPSNSITGEPDFMGIVDGVDGLFEDSAGNTAVTASGDPVGLFKGNLGSATQATASKRPSYVSDANGSYLDFDLVDDEIRIPCSNGTSGLFVATRNGCFHAEVDVTNGEYVIGPYLPPDLIAVGLSTSPFSIAEFEAMATAAQSEGAIIGFSGATIMDSYFRGFSLKTFPLIDTSNATNLYGAWYGNNLTDFPLINTSSVTSLSYTWFGNNLANFPSINTSNVTNFFAAWHGNNLITFPLIDTSSATSFSSAWYGNATMTSFPANMFDNSPCQNYTNAFFGCGLDQASVDNILTSIDVAGQPNVTLGLHGGTNAAPSATGLTAKSNIEGRGGAVTVNS